MVRRTTQSNPNAIALGFKFLRNAKDNFINQISDKGALTYPQFMDRAKKLPTKNYISLSREETQFAIDAMEEIVKDMQETLNIMKATL